MKYTIIIEQAEDNLSAYSPDFPGCAGVGDTVQEARNSIIEAMQIQIEEMLEQQQEIPQPTTIVEQIELPLPQTR